ncbi:MAG: carbohydrate-binding domain-containing protein, partial [Planctomycetaceae bacterium]
MRSVRTFQICCALLAAVSGPVCAQNDDAANDDIIDSAAERPQITNLLSIDAPASAATAGHWSPAARWPLCAIHAALLPNGDVLTYGTDQQANNGLGFVYDRWNPGRGLAPNSHKVLDVQTNNNLFCSAQTLLPGTGGLMLVTGGSVEKNGRRNFGVKAVNVYDPLDDQFFKPFAGMKFARWYPTVTQLADGRVLVQGGRNEQRKPTTTPEIFDPANGSWKALTGARSGVFENGGWNYPRAFMCPNGEVLTMPVNRTALYYVSIRSNGKLRKVRDLPVRVGANNLMAVMYDDSKILSIRARDARKLTLQGKDTIRSDNVSDMLGHRYWADATLLPTGEVLVTGGSRINQSLDGAIRYVEIWDPKTERWRRGAAGTKSRLYHSTSLLLPNGTVLVAGGGPPGPVANLNAEIYYPPYLFTSSGDLRQRPRLLGESGGGTVVRIRARGDEGTERMAISIDGQRVKTFNNLRTTYKSYFYTSDRPITGDQIRIEFLNDTYQPDQGVDSNLWVDWIEIDGDRYQSEDPDNFVFQRRGSGAFQTEVLSQNGYIEYSDQSEGCTDLGRVNYGQTITCDIDRAGTIETARLIRFGSVTHSFDMG